MKNYWCNSLGRKLGISYIGIENGPHFTLKENFYIEKYSCHLVVKWNETAGDLCSHPKSPRKWAPLPAKVDIIVKLIQR